MQPVLARRSAAGDALRRFARFGVALATAIALEAAPFGYLLTTCPSSMTPWYRLGMIEHSAFIVTCIFRDAFVIATIVIVALVYASSRSPQAIRIRNVAIPIVVLAIFALATTSGYFDRSFCALIEP